MPGLDVLFLFGSRARGDVHPLSDWDFAFLGDRDLDADRLLTTLVLAVGTDRVDVADLTRASGLLRYRVARDGQVVIERTPGAADAFRVEAAAFWCDAGTLLEREYDAMLSDLER
jgi:predicted nucleotidyltransferase